MAKKQSENFLEKIPVRVEKYRWSEKDDGHITIEIDNKGFFNRLLQLIAKKPKVWISAGNLNAARPSSVSPLPLPSAGSSPSSCRA